MRHHIVLTVIVIRFVLDPDWLQSIVIEFVTVEKKTQFPAWKTTTNKKTKYKQIILFDSLTHELNWILKCDGIVADTVSMNSKNGSRRNDHKSFDSKFNLLTTNFYYGRRRSNILGMNNCKTLFVSSTVPTIRPYMICENIKMYWMAWMRLVHFRGNESSSIWLLKFFIVKQ